MKTKIILLLIIFLYVNTYAQINFQDHIITTTAYGVFAVCATDIDGDGDKDVISSFYDKIAWYENTDGQGSFGAQQVISTIINYSYSIYTTDIDEDGDMDVLSSSAYDSTIAWYENTDGQGSFGAQQIIASDVIGATVVLANDIDGDDDMDVVAVSWNESKIVWYENTDGQGSFGAQQVISTNVNGTYSIYSTDMDGDDDMDLLATSWFDNKIVWFENTDGQGNFGIQQVITTNTVEASSVYSADLDGDGDMDALSASNGDNKIAWYENTDGQGNFGAQQVITTNVDGPWSIYATDIDGDGDIDVISVSGNDDKLAWYENTDGQGSFGAQQVITTDSDAGTSYTVYATDIDGDNDIDVLATSWADDKIAWYENLSPLDVSENNLVGFSVYPIPTTGILTIQSNTAILQIDIYNPLGQLILSNYQKKTIDISNLNQGLYFVKIKGENGNFGTKKVIKN
jgi:hypothetical protein